MVYTKEQIRKWCGIHWTKLDNILKELDNKDIDWASADWPTICSEASDFGDIEEAVWSHLKSEGIVAGRMISESQLGHEMERYEAGEEEFLQDTKEGVKEILKRIYKDPSISKKHKEKMKQVLKQEGSAYYATLIALYNGESQSFAKRWLGEEVIAPTPEDVKPLIDKPVFSVLSKRGWIKAIDGVYLKQPMRSTKFVKLIPECKLIHSEERGEAGRVAVYRKEEEPFVEVVSVKPHEEVFRVKLPALEPVVPISPIIEEKPVIPAEIIPQPSEDLILQYGYSELKKIARDQGVRVSGSKAKMIEKLLEVGAL